MNPIVTEALAWALIHFVWQGSAIALAAGLIGLACGRMRPQSRYLLMGGALTLMLLAPAVTFAFELRSSPVTSIAAATPHGPRPMVEIGAGPSAAAPSAPSWIPRLVAVWVCGVFLFALRTLSGWAWARRLTTLNVQPAPESSQAAALRLRVALRIRRSVRIVSSAILDVPATVGWLRPVVLLPVSALTSLTPDQIELLLAHELAHVRRYDYLVNLLQTVVEAVLFYHPGVWWVSGQIRAEREHCCDDDLAVAACGDVVAYATTLAVLERLRARRHALVLAADGGSLLARIERLAGRRARRSAPPAWIGGLVPAAVALAALHSVALPPAVAESEGFLQGLAAAGYSKISVDEIIALKDHGVMPEYAQKMRAAGLGVPDVSQLIRLNDHGVEPEYAASVANAGLASGLDFEAVIRLRENGVEPDDLARIRGLGFGPYPVDEVIRLRQNGVDAETFAALLAAGLTRASAADAVEFRQNGITTERIRSMQAQGFSNLSLEQIVKLSRGGVI